MTHASKRCWLPPRNECPQKRGRRPTRLRRATEKTRADPPTRKAWREPSLGEEERGSGGSPIRQTSKAQRPMRGRQEKGTAFGGTPEPPPETARAPRENLFGEAPDAAREAVRAGLAQRSPAEFVRL